MKESPFKLRSYALRGVSHAIPFTAYGDCVIATAIARCERLSPGRPLIAGESMSLHYESFAPTTRPREHMKTLASFATRSARRVPRPASSEADPEVPCLCPPCQFGPSG